MYLFSIYADLRAFMLNVLFLFYIVSVSKKWKNSTPLRCKSQANSFYWHECGGWKLFVRRNKVDTV